MIKLQQQPLWMEPFWAEGRFDILGTPQKPFVSYKEKGIWPRTWLGQVLFNPEKLFADVRDEVIFIVWGGYVWGYYVSGFQQEHF